MTQCHSHAPTNCHTWVSAPGWHLYAERPRDGDLLAQVDLVAGESGDAVAELHLQAHDWSQSGVAAHEACCHSAAM